MATEDEPSRAIVGIDTYEWMGGGRFMVHHIHVRVGDDLVEAIEMIGEPNDGAFTMRSFDNTGAYAEMIATVDGQGVWSFTGDDSRASLNVADDGQTMQARWERRTEVGEWTHWMDMNFTRLS